jgi:hypothetical protein
VKGAGGADWKRRRLASYTGRRQTSRGAIAAQRRGSFSKGRATSLVCARTGVCRARAEKALEATYQGETHHHGPFATPVRYYDVNRAVALIQQGQA